MKYVLFVDDIRHPNYVLTPEMLASYSHDGIIVVWVTTKAQAQWYVETFGMPVLMLLDHDLGIVNGKEETVMEFLNWIERSDRLTTIVPEYRIHSDNSVGRLNIKSFFDTWHKWTKL